ncbi:MAG: DUF3987 domain-containing protein [Bacteroidia bacterium]
MSNAISNDIWDNETLEADEIINHFQELKEKSKERQNPFPVDVFPKAVQEIITATNESLNFPIDFIGGSMLYAVSVAIGNTYKVEIKKGWKESAVLYLAIVGRRGISKSHPLSFALKPIEIQDDINYEKFLSEKKEYDVIVGLPKKERERQGYEEPIKPVWKQHLVTDFTPEALVEVHKFNKRGIGVYADELASWFNNFNRYNKGSEEQFWLSIWSGKPIRINRKTSEPTFIKLPFVSVGGTIQPGVLNQLAEKRTENGFLDRLLFVVPDSLKKECWSETELSPLISGNWETIITNLLKLTLVESDMDQLQPVTIKFTLEAKQLLFQWQSELTDVINRSENEVISGICAKLEVYAIRLALCLEMMRYACGESKKQAVGIEALQGAIKLVEYFKRTAIKVHSTISNASPADKLPTDKKNLYAALPDKFKTGEGVLIAESMGISERTFKRLIRKKELFDNQTRGEYEKLY